MRCANPKCNREFTPNTVRQKYCDVYCSDHMQHAKARKRAKLGRLNTAYKAEHMLEQQTAEQLEEQRLLKIHRERQREDEADALRTVLGYSPSKRIKGEEPVPDTGLSEDEAKAGKMKLEDI